VDRLLKLNSAGSDLLLDEGVNYSLQAIKDYVGVRMVSGRDIHQGPITRMAKGEMKINADRGGVLGDFKGHVRAEFN